jgi:hypothetical protein
MSELNASDCYGCNVAVALLGAIETGRQEADEERAGLLTDGQRAGYANYYDNCLGDATGLRTPEGISGFGTREEYADAMVQSDIEVVSSRDARNKDREVRANALILGCPRLSDRKVQLDAGCRVISTCPGVLQLREIQKEQTGF